ncbi:MAG: YHS domain-containing protein [Isosphaeraceae bacterium]
MPRRSSHWRVLVPLVLALVAGHPRLALSDEPTDSSSEVPEPLSRLSYLIGGWKGTGVPSANRIRGWTESHAWAWAFEKGRPVGLTAELTGNKLLSKLRLTHDSATGRYTLRGLDSSARPIVFTGGFDKAGKTLVLDRDGPTAEGAKQRLTLFPNGNLVRYTLWVSEQGKGVPRFSRTVEIGVTKVGESFAAGSGATSVPQCVVTGGAASITVSYQGKSYPLCCTGCRDEFNENPEKYVRKASTRRESAPPRPLPSASPSSSKTESGRR